MEVPGKQKDTDDNHFITGNNTQIYCEPCDKDDIRLTAHGYCQDCMEHLCETCYKTHRKPAPCRHHVLLNKTQMPMSQSSGHFQVPHDLTEKCRLHKGKLIEYICHDHNVFGCSPCMTISHRSCTINYIPDVSENYDTSNEYRHLLHSLAYLQKQFHALIEETKTNKKKILENKNLVQDEIKKFRQEINNMFDHLERSLLKQVDDIFTKESERIESLSSRSIKRGREIEDLQDKMNELVRAKKTNALYIRSKEYEDFVQKCTSAKKQVCEDNYVRTVVFHPNMNLKEILASITVIGELQRKENVDSIKDSKIDGGSFEMLKAKFSDEINVKATSDHDECCMTGIAVIAKNAIPVVDSINRAVKIVNTETKKIQSTKRLSSRPVTLKLLQNDILSVIIEDGNTIVFLSISNGLAEVRRLKLNGICNDFTYSDTKLIVAFEWSGKIQIMNLDGHVYHSVQNNALDTKYKCPYVVSGGNENIYLTDLNTCTITSINLNGEVLNSYKDERLSRPCGMVVLDDGSILVCSSGNDSIFLIAGNFEKGRAILEKTDGLLCPWSLALDKEQNKLYVGSGERCNFLKVFNLDQHT